MADETLPVTQVEPAAPENNGALQINEAAVPDPRRLAADSIRAPLPPAVYERLGQLVIDERAEAILDEALPPEEADILPDSGFVYAPWEYYARQLNRAFGRAGWTLIPGSPLAQEPNSDNYYRVWILFLGGVYYSEAMASRKYQANNARMTLDDVAEAIRSDCIRRCCKPLGIARECWNKPWREAWRKENAVQIIAPDWKNNNVAMWRRKDAEPFKGERSISPPARQPEAQPQATPPAAATAPAAAAAQPEQKRRGRPAGKVTMRPDAPPAPTPSEPPTPKAAQSAQGRTPLLLDSQVRMLFARARSAALVVGEDASPMIDFLSDFLGAPAILSDGKTSTENCAANFKMVPPNRFVELVKKLDELAKGARPEGGVEKI